MSTKHEQQAREMPPFDDPRVQQVYEILCEDNAAPYGEHWEGFAARRIVAALIAREEMMREALAGAVVAFELLRTDGDGNLYTHVESRSGSMVGVDAVIESLRAVLEGLAPIAAEPAQPEQCRDCGLSLRWYWY